jgi:hypothetical protein
VTDTLYKVLRTDGRCYNGGVGSWPVPNGQPGAWVEATGKLKPCVNGLHLCRHDDLIHWLGPAIFTAEYDGDECVTDGNKIVVRKARLLARLETWNETTMVLFAADCAEAVLHLFEDRFPGDDRPRKAIEAARACSRGEIDAAEAAGAAWAAGAAEAAGAARAAEAAEAAWAARAAEAAWAPRAAGAAEAAEAAWAAEAAGAAEAQTALLFDYLEGRKVA